MHAPLRVFTTRLLWYAISSYLRGWPLSTPAAIVQFANDATLQWNHMSRHQHLFPKRIGLLPQTVISTRDKEMFVLLYDFVRANPRLANHVKLQFREVLRCAVYCQNLDMIRWMYAFMRAAVGVRARPDAHCHSLPQVRPSHALDV